MGEDAAAWAVHEVAVDGEVLHVETAGSGDAVVFCHGLGGTHAVWYQQVARLAGRYRTVTWDARGFGRSTNRAGAGTVVTAARDLAAVLDAVGVERAHVVGQSMGGWTALGFALTHPARVRSLVLTNSLAGLASAAWAEAAAQAPPPPAPVVGVHPALGRHLMATDPAKAFLYQQLGSAAAPPAEARQSLFTTTFDDRVAALACPVLAVASTDDRIFPQAMIEAAVARIPGAQLAVVEDAGHSTFFEQPDRWHAAVEPFWAGVA